MNTRQKGIPRENEPTEVSEGLIRLHKRIANSGLCSRRTAEKFIAEGKVRVNGQIITQMGVMTSDDDEIRVQGRPLPSLKTTIIAMNKPRGYVTTMSDPRHSQTVATLLPSSVIGVKPVGRLDKDTEGLLLFTNDGELALRLTHPRFSVEKEYAVTVRGQISEKSLEKLQKGIYIEGGRTDPAKIGGLYFRPGRDETAFHITIHEGRNRQIRLMCQAIGNPVKTLKRVRIGPLSMRHLPRGQCRLLSQVEAEKLRKAVGLSS